MNEAKWSQGLGKAAARVVDGTKKDPRGTPKLKNHEPETPTKRWRATSVASLKIGSFRDRFFRNSQRPQRLAKTVIVCSASYPGRDLYNAQLYWTGP